MGYFGASSDFFAPVSKISFLLPIGRDLHPPVGGWLRQRVDLEVPQQPPCPITSMGIMQPRLPAAIMLSAVREAVVPAAPMRTSKYSRAHASFMVATPTEAIRPLSSARRSTGR